MQGLQPFDRRFVAERLPRDIRNLLKTYAGHLFVGGGFIRAVVGNEQVNDIDLFGTDAAMLENIARGFQAQRPGSKMHVSKNAITLLTENRMPVQFITRWTFKNPADLVASFDFTVCQAAIWRNSLGEWQSAIGDRFYTDLAGRRLHYTSPKREEEAGGSMLRVLKYVRRGYSIQVGSLGAVIARIAAHPSVAGASESDAAADIALLLREVDPLRVIDGLEVIDEHVSAEAEQA